MTLTLVMTKVMTTFITRYLPLTFVFVLYEYPAQHQHISSPVLLSCNHEFLVKAGAKKLRANCAFAPVAGRANLKIKI